MDFDYSIPGSDSKFVRYYNSILGDTVIDEKAAERYGPFGSYKWSHNYDLLIANPSAPTVNIRLHTGEFLYFSKPSSGNTYSPLTNSNYTLVKDSTGFDLTHKDGTKYRFDLTGKLTSITDAKGNKTTVTTSGSTTTVKDSYGRTITINYTNSLITSVVDPYGKTYTYTYETVGGVSHLKTVTYPDSKTVTYGYGNSSFPHHLTSRTDEKGNIKTWGYDANGRANSMVSGGGLESLSIDYSVSGQTVVTSGENRQKTYAHHKNSGGKELIDSLTGCSSCGSASYTYYKGSASVFNNISTATDRNGNATVYSSYNSKNNPRTVIEKDSSGTTLRTTRYTYNSASEPTLSKRKSAIPFGSYSTASAVFRYDGFNNLTGVVRKGNTRDISGNAVSYSYVSHYRYNRHGQPTEATDPLGRRATFSYYSTAWGNPDHGRLKSITNHLGHVVSFGNYSSGKAGRMVDANGNLTQYSYDPRGRLAAVKAGSRTTRYGYDAFGNMTSTTLPRGNRVGYEYDGANRLVKVKDGQGNYIAYSYDTEGNRTREEVHDSSGSLKKYQDMAYDADNRLWKVTNPDASYAEMLYDGNGNVTSVKDNKGNLVSYIYDALDRLTNAIQPGNITTSYEHDINDNISRLTDGNGHATTYVYDDMGNLVEVNSPDTGLTRHEYDSVGNLIKKKDAKGVEIDYEYDALNRITAIRFPADHTRDITYTYDSPSVSYGIGRLTGMTDFSGSTVYYYDEYGNVVKEEKTFTGLAATFTTMYSYNANNNLSSMTYPDGRVISYVYDEADRVSRVTGSKNNSNKTFADNITHAPFGSISAFTFGNGLTIQRDYDQEYKLTYLKSGPFLKRLFAYDANGNITSITDLVNSAKNQNFSYDALGRLIWASGSYGSLSYAYDNVGNRLSKNGTSYTYASGTNKLTAVSGAESATFGYENNGNMVSDGKFTYEYSAGGVPLSVFGNPALNNSNLYIYTGNNPVNYIDPYGLLFGDKIKAYYEDRIEYNFQHGYTVAAFIDAMAITHLGSDVDLALNLMPLGKVKAVGELSEALMETHHLLPKQLKPFFSSLGLNIEEYTLEMSKVRHRLRSGPGIHCGDFEKSWNGKWEAWIEEHPDATAEDVLKQLEVLIKEFGL